MATTFEGLSFTLQLTAYLFARLKSYIKAHIVFLVFPKRLSFLIIRSIYQFQYVHKISTRTDYDMSAQNKNALNDLCVEILKHVSISSGYTGYNAGVPMTFTGYTDRQLMGVSAGSSENQIMT